MSRRYRRPPLVEAVVEFHFSPVEGWDEGVIDGIVSDLASIVDERGVIRGMEGQIVIGPASITQQTVPVERVRLSSATRPIIVQLTPNLLAVNHLVPYSHWEDFVIPIRGAYKSYVQNAEPRALNRVVVNYLNIIRIPELRVRMEDYFDVYPHLGPELPQTHARFLLSVDLPYEAGRDVLRVQLATTQSPSEDICAFSLTLQYLPGPGAAPVGDPFDVLDMAHAHIEAAFEGSITERTRALFEEIM